MRWVADKLDVDKTKVGRWRKKWKENPLLGYDRKQVMRMVRKDEVAKRRATRKLDKNQTVKKKRVHVRALVLESEGGWDHDERRYITGRKWTR